MREGLWARWERPVVEPHTVLTADVAKLMVEEKHYCLVGDVSG